MKGDPLLHAVCPYCGDLVGPKSEWRRHCGRHGKSGVHTPKAILRRMFYEHLNSCRPALGCRERSLVIDAIVGGLS